MRITKAFPGVVALKGVNFSLEAGEIHSLVGENGSGKSTLVNIIGGVHRPDFGQIFLGGKEVSFSSPSMAIAGGISILSQELILAENLSIAENVLMGQIHRFRSKGFLNKRRLGESAAEILKPFGHALDPNTKVSSLLPWEKRIIQIAKALAKNSRILALDEATSALSVDDSLRLFNVMKNLKKNGVAIIFVTHKLDEALTLGDRTTVIRDGNVIATVASSEATTKDLVRMMVGKELDIEQTIEARASSEAETPLLAAEGISTSLLKDVTLQLYAGEVMGLVGLVGSGKTELIRSILGLDRKAKGVIKLNGRTVAPTSMREAKRIGFGYLPDDKRLKGLVTRMKIRENVTLPILASIAKGRFITDEGEEREITGRWMKDLEMAAKSPEVVVANLSGGTQQKVVIAKWLATSPTVFLCDEPTVGVDVVARMEIHNIIRKLARQGKAILWSTSDLDDALGVCDRIIVMRRGAILREFSTATTSKATIMDAMMGGVRSG